MSAVFPAEGPHPSRLSSIGVLIVCLAACFAAAGLGSLLTVPNLDGWYAHLVKPPFNPPNWIFAPVWTVLFVLMAVAMWRVWVRGDGHSRRYALTAFAIQLVLNVAWSAAFFALHAPGLAVLVIFALIAAIGATIFFFRRIDRPAAWMLLPYLAWVFFATLLNLSIFVLN